MVHRMQIEPDSLFHRTYSEPDSLFPLNCIGPDSLFPLNCIGPDSLYTLNRVFFFFDLILVILTLFSRCILSGFSPGFLLDFEEGGDIEKKLAAGPPFLTGNFQTGRQALQGVV